MKRKKWCVSAFDKSTAQKIAQSYGIDSFAALLLTSRGITEEEQIKQFVFDEGSLCDPFSIIDMDKAADRINAALDSGEKIAVYGDYDADGVTATALLYSYLEALGGDVTAYIPDREKEGYGLNTDAIDRLSAQGVGLIVTVDNGISAINEAKYIKQLGMELVVTDHHKVGNILPEACAVVDPHRADCTSEFHEWAGVGVAFKLCCALSGDESDVLDSYADLVAIGTVGDIVSLTGENRDLVRLGIKKLQQENSAGVQALKRLSGIEGKPITSSSLAFSIVPRINAVGRIASASPAFELLVSDSEEKAMEIAEGIDSCNAKRQSLEQQITLDALSQLGKNPSMQYDRVLIFSGKNWHSGVIGIVAARFVDRFQKPCIVIADDGEYAKGSGRSLDGFSLYDAINSASDILTRFGGHTLAAGFSIMSKDIDEFCMRVNSFAKTVVMPFKKNVLDCRLRPEYISSEILPVISMLEPFGADNPQPVFGLFDMTLNSVQPIGSGKHVRLSLSKDRTTVTAVKFGLPAREFPYKPGDKLDLAVRLEKNEYMGVVRVGIYINDMRMSKTDDDVFLSSVRLYEKLRRHDSVTAKEARLACPDRSFIASVFRFVRDNTYFDGYEDVLCYRLGDDGSQAAKVLSSIEILRELKVFVLQPDGEITVDSSVRVKLEESALFNYLNNYHEVSND